MRRKGQRRLRRNQSGMPRVKEVAFRPNAPGAREATEFYWGIPAKRRFEWDDPVMFARNADLVQIGKLLEFKVSNKAFGRSRTIRFPGRSGPTVLGENHLVYDRKSKGQRIYALLGPQAMQRMKALYRSLKRGGAAEYSLRDVAKAAGGRHARDRWPDGSRKVVLVGYLQNYIYATRKNKDDCSILPNGRVVGPGSAYDHAASEETKVNQPILAVDSTGRLWICGGAYRVETSGIAD